MISYDFFESDKLLIIKFDGDITENDLKGWLPFIFSKLVQNPINFGLYDFRTALLNFDLDSVERIKQFITPFYDQFSKFESVYLVAKPQVTALIIFFSFLLQNDSIIVSTVSTIDKAIQLLHLRISPTEFENRIQNLRFHFIADSE